MEANGYDRHIISILTEAGRGGMTPKKIAVHVCNLSSSLFETADFDEVYRYVQNFVRRHQKGKKPLLKATKRRGYYRLVSNHAFLSQFNSAPEP